MGGGHAKSTQKVHSLESNLLTVAVQITAPLHHIYLIYVDTYIKYMRWITVNLRAELAMFGTKLLHPVFVALVIISLVLGASCPSTCLCQKAQSRESALPFPNMERLQAGSEGAVTA